jgi:hypothetical protein
MYLVKSDKDMLDSCFKCNSYLANYLMRTEHLPLLHKDKKDYYFVRTVDLEIAIERLPSVVRIINSLGI